MTPSPLSAVFPYKELLERNFFSSSGRDIDQNVADDGETARVYFVQSALRRVFIRNLPLNRSA
jgi:hypothetical protein